MSPTTKDHFLPGESALQRDLRLRVDAYFAQTGRSRFATWGMVLKTVFYLAGAAGLVALLASGVLPAWAALGLCLVLGAFVAGIGFNVGHDAIHGSWSKRPWVNRLLGHSFDLIGANAATWSRAHNVVHHTYTNIPGVDRDLEPGPWLRFYQRPGHLFFHRWQHWYAMALYGLTSIVWIFVKDTEEAWRPDLRTGKRATARQWVSIVAWKGVHFALFLGLPIAFSGYPLWQLVVGYLAMHAVAGVTLAVVFQLAHVVEHVEFPAADGRMTKYSWAEHQLRTTADFSPGSAVTTFWTGGLNHQIEHHLFARVCHAHYPALAPIVREVAAAHGIPYVVNRTFFGAVASHLRMLKRFGRPEPLVGPVAVAAPVAP